MLDVAVFVADAVTVRGKETFKSLRWGILILCLTRRGVETNPGGDPKVGLLAVMFMGDSGRGFDAAST